MGAEGLEGAEEDEGADKTVVPSNCTFLCLISFLRDNVKF